MSKVGNMQFFQELYSHIDMNSGKKFEDMFLIKIANKGSSLRESSRVATDLENMENMENLENSGNLKNCENLREI